ncbi:hypothetical protein PIB30_030075 [Stylosanthes scabra]|uniref:Uncharacterized protein n=1 Tax=Stylosanthes scabra TaxID=79078 RepID=A0ABU6V9J7_9FABA|nr:hypothetical protein [Stylosanthes scabra]
MKGSCSTLVRRESGRGWGTRGEREEGHVEDVVETRVEAWHILLIFHLIFVAQSLDFSFRLAQELDVEQ